MAFFEKKFNFLCNRLTDKAEIFYRKTTKKDASNESNPKVLLQTRQELWFYEDLKISVSFDIKMALTPAGQGTWSGWDRSIWVQPGLNS